MDVYEAIEQRYSVRSYESRRVEDDTLERILDAGRLAPSARNNQDWKFIVVRQSQLRSSLAEAAEQPFLASAPVILAVVDTGRGHVMSCGVPSGPVNCAIAIDHMTLAATAEGLGTCWIGHFDQDQCRRILGVPPEHVIIELLPIGYPASAAAKKVRKPVEEVVVHETFS